MWFAPSQIRFAVRHRRLTVRRFSPSFAFGYGGQAAAAHDRIGRRRLQTLASCSG
jgi:hypothetical protein